MTAKESKALARKFFELYNDNKPGEADKFVAASFVSHDPATPDLPKGPEAFRKILKTYRTAFPDSRFTIDEQIAEGNLVVTRWTAKGTHKGPLRGIAPTNKKVTITGLTMDRIADGKVAESWVNWDAFGMMQQIGAVPTPKKTTAR